MTTYARGILEAHDYLLSTYPEVMVMGQGVRSPWYVGATMGDLDKKFGSRRVIDTPVSEAATTGAGLGYALAGGRSIIIHPRMDFAILAMDSMVNQAARWNNMFGGDIPVPLTVRAIINRGGEQGAQHSQALHSWFAHVPGLRVVMPATPGDARDLFVASVLCDDPVIYIDDRWLYELDEELGPIEEVDLRTVGPVVRRPGTDVTIAAAGYSVQLALDAAELLAEAGVQASVVDLRVVNPIDPSVLLADVAKTGRLLALDGGWSPCGLSSEVIALVAESGIRSTVRRRALPFAGAPTSKPLEAEYYPTADVVAEDVRQMMEATE